MNKLTPIAAGLLIEFSAPAFADQAQDIKELQQQVRELKKESADNKDLQQQLRELKKESADNKDLQQQVRELQKDTGGNNLKFNVDYRVTMDSLEYKMADGKKHKNSNLFSNRLELGFGYQPKENLVFSGLLSYNKVFGQNEVNHGMNQGMGQFDWIVNENPNDNVVRIKEVNVLYLGDNFLGSDLDWTGSIGRRPSTNGFLANNREGYDKHKSPLGHSINVEFDGFSLGVHLEDLTGVSGMAAKICAGRGVSESSWGRFSSGGTDYATQDGGLENVDMAGLIFTPYNDGQYDIKAQYYYATNMLDFAYNPMDPTKPPGPTNPMVPDKNGKMAQVGDLQNFTLSMQVNGVGEFINDFLDDTVLFASASISQSLPDNDMAGNNKGMFGSQDKETGYSFWVGATFPGFMEEDRFGLEYNHGSEYWRSFTYGEDTLIGSKLATRGNAYEVYYNIPITGKEFFVQFRYTFIDYSHSGSNNFFGNSGMPMTMDKANAAGMGGLVADTAQDFRIMLRYKY